MPASLSNIPAFDYDELAAVLKKCTSDADLYDCIVNAPFAYHVQTVLLFLGIIVLLQVNKTTGTIDRIALSSTDMAASTTRVSRVDFHDIKIGLDDPDNVIAQAIKSGKPQHTADWKFLFVPAMAAEDARINQASAGIASSTVYPLASRDGGALIYSYYQYPQHIGQVQDAFMQRYTALVDQFLS